MKLDTKQLQQITILYVEDDDVVRVQTEKILDKLFKKVYVGIDGEEGLHLCNSIVSSSSTSAKSLTLFNNRNATRGVPLLLRAISKLDSSLLSLLSFTDANLTIFDNSVSE